MRNIWLILITAAVTAGVVLLLVAARCKGKPSVVVVHHDTTYVPGPGGKTDTVVDIRRIRELERQLADVLAKARELENERDEYGTAAQFWYEVASRQAGQLDSLSALALDSLYGIYRLVCSPGRATATLRRGREVRTASVTGLRGRWSVYGGQQGLIVGRNRLPDVGIEVSALALTSAAAPFEALPVCGASAALAVSPAHWLTWRGGVVVTTDRPLSVFLSGTASWRW